MEHTIFTLTMMSVTGISNSETLMPLDLYTTRLKRVTPHEMTPNCQNSCRLQSVVRLTVPGVSDANPDHMSVDPCVCRRRHNGTFFLYAQGVNTTSLPLCAGDHEVLPLCRLLAIIWSALVIELVHQEDGDDQWL